MIDIGGLKVDLGLYQTVNEKIIPGTDVDPKLFWRSLEQIVKDLGPKNRHFLEKRAILQEKIDAWHLDRKGRPLNLQEYKEFLMDVGYLIPEGDHFQITTANVDSDISKVAGPQLVVPLDNARYSLNAANARWASLYDAYYGTDMILEEEGAIKGERYNPVRGEKVVKEVEFFLDEVVGLEEGRYSEVVGFSARDVGGFKELVFHLEGGRSVGLKERRKFVGFVKKGTEFSCVLLKNNELHIEIQVDRDDPIGNTHPAGIKDVVMEAAITTIQDCEDSVSAVDAEDKVRVYENWNGLMKGSLETTFEKNGKYLTRKLNPDREYEAPDGSHFTLSGRSLLLIRNVGIHMYTDCVTTSDGGEIPEGFLDAMVTGLAAIHDLKRNGEYVNSQIGSIYIVKPKLHGSEEVSATAELFGRVEQALGLETNTIKVGIMDEERRTTVNLKEAIREVSERVVFINTGFLDRTGDEIHTSMEAGPMLPKMEIKTQPWIFAYENWNVDVGLETGFTGRAQIGKGMWTMPDEMRQMVDTKISHPQAGASTAWVPSPTAAALHAMHYHRLNVAKQQAKLTQRKRASLDDILKAPLLDRKLTSEEIQQELNNNVQGILGYVVRWVDQGIGCSKVPDILDVGLMEDRATLRISSQHIANWIHHKIVTEDQARKTFEKMAFVVDRQNQGDKAYKNMAPQFGQSIAFQAAIDLVFKGREVTNGYTELVLHSRRREVKSNL